LTVRRCLEVYAGYCSAPRDIAETIGLVGLEENADTWRAVVGRAAPAARCGAGLIGDPELIFLDEPTTGFDPSVQRAAWSVVSGLGRWARRCS
jgi:ABC-2 type transport system ATP-binding protein